MLKKLHIWSQKEGVSGIKHSAVWYNNVSLYQIPMIITKASNEDVTRVVSRHVGCCRCCCYEFITLWAMPWTAS